MRLLPRRRWPESGERNEGVEKLERVWGHHTNISQKMYLVNHGTLCWPCGARNGDTVLLLFWTICAERFSKCEMPELFCSISQPNRDRFKVYIHYFKARPEPVKMAYHKLKCIEIWTSSESKSPRKLRLGIFPTTLVEIEFINYNKSQLKVCITFHQLYLPLPALVQIALIQAFFCLSANGLRADDFDYRRILWRVMN